MRAGTLDKRITIQSPPTSTDTYGQPLDIPWVDVCTVWAAIEPLQGKEYHAAAQDNAEVETRIRIRYRTGINRTMRAKYGNVIFEILDTINPKFANVELQLMCKERQ